ncbi:MAG: efflux RND transporter periplasmic adaptor subunit [Desulfovibrionaceae bacterium]|nr:efflux RND transporter periplasmic adaptor subunit [Desulfovibrionaceae bacterium]MBF0513499.1 efflux RND transporter periplasmic adaptor subunit [Desulfovibrionaceae bacterium]
MKRYAFALAAMAAGLIFFVSKAPAQPGKPLSAVLEAKQQAVLSAEVTAKVEHIVKELGQKFSKGDLLIALDEGSYRPSVSKNQAAASAANKNFEVTQKLYEGKSASPLDLENARKDVGMASANVALSQKELAGCRIYAPFSGRVKKVYVREYELVDKGKPLIEVVDDHLLQARILLPSTLFGKVHVGQEVSIEVVETGATAAGTITNVGEVLDPASATYEIYADVPNTGDSLRSGMTGRLAPPADAAQ